ncbi:hypothetical protein [Sphingobacterium siyangense]|uniref:Uncharacterized protein n=1 Tax=Sphingobacterium siyangense TaxID=459529 RepID=A0A562MRH4_9SPHI|nr:hypothetical protein [Sphingobacterium siyangense]TWI22181.1 hypothetical protein IQ31_01586 [Sphingobacterium siyangense]
MKRILFALFILFSSWSIVVAQTEPDISKYNFFPKEEALEFAKQCAALSKTKWVFLKDKEITNPDYYVVTFVNSLDETETMKFNFIKRYLNSNEDLEIKGDPSYRFQDVYGKYLDLFPIWERFFKPGVPLEATIEEPKFQVINYGNSRFRLLKDGKTWSIRNWS